MGCGVCVPACPEGNIVLEDILNEGIRPRITGKCLFCGECIVPCPGLGYDSPQLDEKGTRQIKKKEWGLFGKALEIWEGCASDKRIREKSSSGGLITALAWNVLKSGRVHSVFHIQEDPENPLRNITRISKSESEVVDGSGSRYAPSSPCELFNEMLHESSKRLFIGKPCDVGALKKFFNSHGIEKNEWPITIGIFCAGVPSSGGTRELLEINGVDSDKVFKIRYRGNGWPGYFEAVNKFGETLIKRDYESSWGYLQSFRPFRCYLCPDGTSESADISLGDAWYKKEYGGDGLSLGIIRTKVGQEIFHKCIQSGDIDVLQVSEEEVLSSQKNLIGKRKSVFGRIATLRLMGIQAPKYKGFNLFKVWLQMGTLQQIKSITGTVRRALTRGYHFPEKF